ncbi:GMC family oxidoreductase N-terminal domain-containing protein [Acerihabitans sp. TG2]|uniref:GMC family oxidoreductase n=1 Tax=Acerihabitans sp. TG2 TaxID=3096008 RepID=UPI002B227882|nr:GMC family oxidoreductase N-terminal domain-containing protein [Acerihabitans sp. TG2]MEA9391253.1 GMC family oxidoreductase N-terminal domain-containing protein [Acerihabitans sp. TG2]
MPEQPEVTHFDVLIIGAGSTGSVLAARLSADPACRVGVLEAGEPPRDPDIARPEQWPFIQGRDYDWQFVTAAQAGTANRVHPWPRGKIVGGSSCLHAMAHVRGHPDDFAPWVEATGDARWHYRNLLPYFIRSESFSGGASDIHGDSGPMPVWLPQDELSPVVRAYMQAGLDFGVPYRGDHNGWQLNGVAANSLTIRHGRRVSTADAWLTPALSRDNLRLFTGVMVETLSLTAGRVTAVNTQHDGRMKRFTAERIILCAGAIASPLLLMRSGIGPATTLQAAGVNCRHGLPWVGENLHDHLLGAGNVYTARRPVPPTRLQHSESLMYLNSTDPTVEQGPPDVVLGCVAAASVAEGFISPAPGSAFTLLFGVTHPTSRGRLAIVSADSRATPFIDPAYLHSEHDRQAFVRALTLARAIGGGRALKEWRETEYLPGVEIKDDAQLNHFIARAAITHHHPVGTCQMGRDAATSVVDGRLKVHGVDNVWIVDASAIPCITSGPIHAALLAMAESFAADFWS